MNRPANRLADQLRALPPCTPPADGWRRLSAALDAPRRRPRPLPLALAASLLVAVAAGLVWQRPVPVPQAADLSQLMASSQALERDLALLRPQVPVWNARHAALAEQLEGRLAVIDLQLNYAGPANASRLWQDRVALMADLVETHRSASLQPPPAAEASKEWSL